MVLCNSWSSVRHGISRRLPDDHKPRSGAGAATRTNVTQIQHAKTYSSAGCLRCCVADTPRTPLAASKRHRCRLTIAADSRRRLGSQQAASTLVERELRGEAAAQRAEPVAGMVCVERCERQQFGLGLLLCRRRVTRPAEGRFGQGAYRAGRPVETFLFGGRVVVPWIYSGAFKMAKTTPFNPPHLSRFLLDICPVSCHT